MERVEVRPPDGNPEHPLINTYAIQVSVADAAMRLQKKLLLPDFSGRVFSQRLYGVANPVSGFSLTVGIPLAAGSFKRRIDAAQIERTAKEKLLQAETQRLISAAQESWQRLGKAEEALTFYETHGLGQASQLASAAEQSYRAGEISFAELSQFLTQATLLRIHYLDALYTYNHQAIEYNYYQNEN